MEHDGADDGTVAWALRYDGYARLAGTPEALERVLGPVRRLFDESGTVPAWAGVDLLRGWAFLLVRSDRHQGGGTLGAEWEAVLAGLRQHPHGSRGDRPPVPLRAGERAAAGLSTAPRQHANPDFLAAKRRRLSEPHVAPVNAFVDAVRAELAVARGAPQDGVHVPYVDPDSAGVGARVLFVLESPAGPAALGSGMLSPDNDDATAQNMWRAYEASGLPRTAALHWDAVPWFIGDGVREANVSRDDVEQGRAYLVRLVELLPDLDVVVGVGRPAQRSIAGISADLGRRGPLVREVPHPSPRVVASTRGANLEALAAVMREVRVRIEEPG